jgi:hypothetical protein
MVGGLILPVADIVHNPVIYLASTNWHTVDNP